VFDCSFSVLPCENKIGVERYRIPPLVGQTGAGVEEWTGVLSGRGMWLIGVWLYGGSLL